MIQLSLKGKRAIVCGSTQGIGKAAALELADLGAEIILLARDEKKLAEVKNELSNDHGQKHTYLAVDFSKPEDLASSIQAYLKSSNSVHILVNNTGGPLPGLAIDSGPDSFIKAFNSHLICNQILVQALVPGMKKEGYGRIINIISTSVKQPIPGLGVSNTIRAAVAGWSKTLSLELASYGITVNNILPGATATGRLEAIIEDKSKKLNKPMQEVEAEMKKEIPAGRFAEPRELGYAVAFLASPAAAYINGVSMAVDGGRTACL